MRPRHPLPRKLPKRWLVSDARAETDLAELAALVPPGSGIIFRHDGLASGPRWRLLRRLIRTARARGLVVLLAGPADNIGGASCRARGGQYVSILVVSCLLKKKNNTI